MKQFNYDKYLENNPLLKEVETEASTRDYISKGENEVIFRLDDSIETMKDIFDQIINNPTKNIRGLAKYGMETLEDIQTIVNQLRK